MIEAGPLGGDSGEYVGRFRGDDPSSASKRHGLDEETGSASRRHGLDDAMDRVVQVAEGGPEDSLRRALFWENMLLVQEEGAAKFNRGMPYGARMTIRRAEIVRAFQSIVRLILLEWGFDPEAFMRDYEAVWRERMG